VAHNLYEEYEKTSGIWQQLKEQVESPKVAQRIKEEKDKREMLEKMMETQIFETAFRKQESKPTSDLDKIIDEQIKQLNV